MRIHDMEGVDGERFLRLATVLVQAQIEVDDELSKDLINPREVLPGLAIIRALVAEMEEVLLRVLSSSQAEAQSVASARKALMEYVPPAGDPRLPIGQQGVAAKLIQDLTDACVYKHHRLSNERLDSIIAHMSDRSEQESMPDLGAIAQSLLSPKSGGMVS